MPENMFCKDHKANSKSFRDNFDTIFRNLPDPDPGEEPVVIGAANRITVLKDRIPIVHFDCKEKDNA